MATVRWARADEADQVLDFYTRMIDGMRGTEFDVCWEHDVHPTRAFLRASTEAGEVLAVVAPEGGAAGSCFAAALVLNAEADPGYGQARWQVDAAPDEVLVVHVLATLPQFHGRGYARQLLEGAIAAARGGGEGAAAGHLHRQRARPAALRVVRLRELRRLRGLLSPPRPRRSVVRVRAVAEGACRPNGFAERRSA